MGKEDFHHDLASVTDSTSKTYDESIEVFPGVQLLKGTATRILDGKLTGGHHEIRWEAARALERDNASRKDMHYGVITEAGLALRNTGLYGNPNRYTPVSFTEDIAKELNMTPNGIRIAFRAMREDLVFGQFSREGSQMTETLDSVFNQFVSDYQAGYRGAPQNVKDFARAWDGETVSGFYRNLYENLRTRAIGTWAPYEVEVFNEYYDRRLSTNASLSPFDRIILTIQRDGIPDDNAARGIRELTGIPHNQEVTYSHLNVLLL